MARTTRLTPVAAPGRGEALRLVALRAGGDDIGGMGIVTSPTTIDLPGAVTHVGDRVSQLPWPGVPADRTSARAVTAEATGGAAGGGRRKVRAAATSVQGVALQTGGEPLVVDPRVGPAPTPILVACEAHRPSIRSGAKKRAVGPEEDVMTGGAADPRFRVEQEAGGRPRLGSVVSKRGAEWVISVGVGVVGVAAPARAAELGAAEQRLPACRMGSVALQAVSSEGLRAIVRAPSPGERRRQRLTHEVPPR